MLCALLALLQPLVAKQPLQIAISFQSDTRMSHPYYFRFALLLGAALATACTKCTEPLPNNCSIPATVQYPICNVLNCPSHPILLVLANGQQLNPSGPVWDNFWASTQNTFPQEVKIEYTPLATQAIYTWSNATITCISEVEEVPTGQ